MQEPTSKSAKNSRSNSGDLKLNLLQSTNFSNNYLQDCKKNKASLPIPKGETPYALAKIAEYQDRDLDKAEYYYKLAIKKGERVKHRDLGLRFAPQYFPDPNNEYY